MTRLNMLLSLIATTFLLSTGCSEATGPDDDVPVGLKIHLNGTLVVQIEGSSITGDLHVHVGEYSGQFIITATNGAGNLIDEPFHLEATTDDPAIAQFVQPVEGALEGEIVAVAIGDTRLRLVLSSGGGAPVFTAPPIEVAAVVCGEPAIAGTGPNRADLPASCVGQ